MWPENSLGSLPYGHSGKMAGDEAGMDGRSIKGCPGGVAGTEVGMGWVVPGHSVLGESWRDGSSCSGCGLTQGVPW